MRKLILVIVMCFAAQQTSAQGFPPLERILLPLFAEQTPGAYGSLWATEVWIYNDNDKPAGVGNLFPPDGSNILPKQSRSAVGYGPGPARSITVLADEAPRLHFNLRVRDRSRQAQTAGTEIPVVRESEFLSGKVILLNVPAEERFRQMLRVYQFVGNGQAPGSVRVRFFRIGNVPDALVHEETLFLDAPGQSPLAYAQSALNPAILDASAVRIEMESLSPSMRYWGFVSVINNETQHVTTITPQQLSTLCSFPRGRLLTRKPKI